jgi:hypothetical protein
MKKILIFILILNSFIVNAQNLDSIYRIIALQPETEQTFYIKSRFYILENIKSNNHQNVIDLLNYYSLKFVDSIEIINQDERILINFWMQKYDTIISQIGTEDIGRNNYYKYFLTRYYPDSISDYFSDNSDQLYAQIRLSQCSDIEKEFLELYLRSILLDYKDYAIQRDELNQKANEFLLKNGDNQFSDFVRNNIRYQWEKTNFSIGGSLFGGAGFYTSEMNRYFSFGALLGTEININFWRVNSYFRYYFGSGKAQTTFDYDNITWNKNQKIYSGSSEISIGFTLIDYEKIKVSPSYGISWLTISQNNEYESTKNNQKDPSIKIGTNQIVGINLFWGAFKTKQGINSRFYQTEIDDAIFRLRIGYAVSDHHSNYDSRFKFSDYLVADIGVGFLIQPRKRIK